MKLDGLSIFEQLKIEEALLRVGTGNWCLINTGSPPAVVMGISGKAERLVHFERLKQEKIPLIKRFSGGGTVYIDPDTIFVTFISDAKSPPQSRAILNWSAEVYAPFFKNFEVRENDYVFGERKFGGNAQYIQKNRWLHHTSFLWSFDSEKMQCLKMPERRPQYRGDREHGQFLCSLCAHFPNKQQLIEELCSHFERTLPTRSATLEEISHLLELPHRTSTLNIPL